MDLGLTQQEVADALGVHHPYLGAEPASDYRKFLRLELRADAGRSQNLGKLFFKHNLERFQDTTPQ